MATLPQFQSDDLTVNLLQNKWGSQLNPLLANPSNNASILKSVSLTTGTNTINHRLGKKLQGWRIIRQRSAASLYDNQDTNQMPELTLVLVSTADCVCDIEVF